MVAVDLREKCVACKPCNQILHIFIHFDLDVASFAWKFTLGCVRRALQACRI